MSAAPFFILLDVLAQMRKVLKGCDLQDLTKPLQHSELLSDISNGTMYRDFVEATGSALHLMQMELHGTPMQRLSCDLFLVCRRLCAR